MSASEDFDIMKKIDEKNDNYVHLNPREFIKGI